MRVGQQTKENVLAVVEDQWERRDELDTAVNGWLTKYTVAEEVDIMVQHTRRTLRHLVQEGKLERAETVHVVGQTGTIATFAPADAVDTSEPEVRR